MVPIAISSAAYDAICATLPLGSAAVEPYFNERGERTVWLEAAHGRERVGRSLAEALRPAANSGCRP